MIMFNLIQVINYWFILHCTLRPLYQQVQIFSFNIWGILDHNVTWVSKISEIISSYLKTVNLSEEFCITER